MYAYGQSPASIDVMISQLQQTKQQMQAQQQAFQQAQQWTPGNYQPQHQPVDPPIQNTQPQQTNSGVQVFKVSNQADADNYPVDEGGVVVLLQEDGQSIYVKKHNKSNWKTEFDVWDKREKLDKQAEYELILASRSTDDAINELKADISELKILLLGVIKNDGKHNTDVDIQSSNESTATPKGGSHSTKAKPNKANQEA